MWLPLQLLISSLVLQHWPAGENQSLNASSKIDYLIQNLQSNYDGLSPECLKVVESLADDKSDKMWLVKMFDASSKPSGILKGNVRDYGNFDECLEIEESVNGVEVLGMHCASSLSVHVTEELPVTLSVCVPNVCDLSTFIKPKDDIITFSGLLCQTKRSNTEFDAGDWSMTIVVVIIFAIMALSTWYDTHLRNRDKEPPSQLLIAFSVYTNGEKLLKTSNNPEMIQCLNGLRFISMIWVIAGHRFASMLAIPMINYTDAIEFRDGIQSFYIQGGRVAVDTFFFMSAFLSSYMYFKKVEKKPLTFVQLPLYYLHRFLRITPALAAMYFLHLTIIRRIGAGPIWNVIFDYTRESCMKWWWTFFLYLQNYVNYTDMCIIPTWYLSADMQMFLVAPFLIIPLGNWIRSGKKSTAYIVCGIVIVLCTFIPMIIDCFRDNDNEYETHTRLSVYVIGILMGMAIVDLKKRKHSVNALSSVAIWAFFLCAMLLIVIYTQDVRNDPVFQSTLKINLFYTFSRPVWTIGLCWIVYSCTTGSGGFVNWFLGRPIFQVLGKLCYCMYLLHNPIITISIASAKNSIYFSSYNSIYFWCGDLIFTLLLSTIWYLTFESPMIVVESVIFGRGKKIPKKDIESTLPPKEVH